MFEVKEDVEIVLEAAGGRTEKRYSAADGKTSAQPWHGGAKAWSEEKGVVGAKARSGKGVVGGEKRRDRGKIPFNRFLANLG